MARTTGGREIKEGDHPSTTSRSEDTDSGKSYVLSITISGLSVEGSQRKAQATVEEISSNLIDNLTLPSGATATISYSASCSDGSSFTSNRPISG